jgi:hypothetical protein
MKCESSRLFIRLRRITDRIVLEGSIEGWSWTELDRRTNNGDLNNSHAIHSFSIAKSVEYRFIRLRQTGKNHESNDILAFYHLDVFGSLRECAGVRTLSVAPGKSDPHPVPSLTSSSVVVDHTRTELLMNPAKPFEGILSHLSQMHRGNIHEKGIVTITSSSIIDNDPRHSPNNLLDSNIQHIFSSKNESNQRVQFDFHRIPVSAIHYVIQSLVILQSTTSRAQSVACRQRQDQFHRLDADYALTCHHPFQSGASIDVCYSRLRNG